MGMSLKRRLTGQPGNIEEFAQMVKEENLSVNALLHVWFQPDLITSGKIWGEIRYSAKNIKLIQKERLDRADITFYNGEEMIEVLRKEAQPTLDYLSRQDIKYKLEVFDEYSRSRN